MKAKECRTVFSWHFFVCIVQLLSYFTHLYRNSIFVNTIEASSSHSIRHLRLNYDVNSQVAFLSRQNKIGWRNVSLNLDRKKSPKRTSKDLYFIFPLETYGYHGACYHWVQLFVMAWIAPLGFSDLALHGQIRVNGYLRRRLRHRSDLHIST